MDSVEAFITDWPDDQQREILHFLHQIISELPNVSSKIRYRIPFYYRKSWFCYLNPLRRRSGVELVFIRGNELSNAKGWLEARDRQQVRGVIFESTAAISLETLLPMLDEALLLGEVKPYRGPGKRN